MGREVLARVSGQADEVTAIAVHYIDLGGPVRTCDKGDPRAVGRPGGQHIVAAAEQQTPFIAAIGIYRTNIGPFRDRRRSFWYRALLD